MVIARVTGQKLHTTMLLKLQPSSKIFHTPRGYRYIWLSVFLYNSSGRKYFKLDGFCQKILKSPNLLRNPFQLCTRFCFYGAFASAASCSHPRLINFPEQKLFWNVTRPCDLTTGGEVNIVLEYSERLFFAHFIIGRDANQIGEVMIDFANSVQECPCPPSCFEVIMFRLCHFFWNNIGSSESWRTHFLLHYLQPNGQGFSIRSAWSRLKPLQKLDMQFRKRQPSYLGLLLRMLRFYK